MWKLLFVLAILFRETAGFSTGFPGSVCPKQKFSSTDNDPTAQDDELEILLSSLRNETCFHCPVDQKMAHVLNDANMTPLLKEKTVFAVLFWLNVDTLSRAALHVMIKVSTMMAENMENSPIGTVACNDWPDVCEKYSVNTWPKLVLFREGQIYKEYRGIWDASLIVNWIKMFYNPAIKKLMSVQEVQEFTEGKGLLTGDSIAPAVTLIAMECLADGSEAAMAASAVGQQLHGRYFIGAALGEVGKMWMQKFYPEAQMPLVLTFKPKDQFEPVRMLPANKCTCQKALGQFIVDSSRPTVMKITELNFPGVYRLHKPLLVAIGDVSVGGDVYKLLGGVAKEDGIGDLVSVGYIEKMQMEGLTKKILELLKLTSDKLPLLILSDPSRGVLFLYPELSVASVESVKYWIQNVAGGKEKPAAHLERRNLHTRPLMYDYKGFIYGEDSLRYSDWLKKMEMSGSSSQAGEIKVETTVKHTEF